MILTEEWTREVAKHQKIINDLEKRYEEKCKALKVCIVSKNELFLFYFYLLFFLIKVNST